MDSAYHKKQKCGLHTNLIHIKKNLIDRQRLGVISLVIVYISNGDHKAMKQELKYISALFSSYKKMYAASEWIR